MSIEKVLIKWGWLKENTEIQLISTSLKRSKSKWKGKRLCDYVLWPTVRLRSFAQKRRSWKLTNIRLRLSTTRRLWLRCRSRPCWTYIGKLPITIIILIYYLVSIIMLEKVFSSLISERKSKRINHNVFSPSYFLVAIDILAGSVSMMSSITLSSFHFLK